MAENEPLLKEKGEGGEKPSLFQQKDVSVDLGQRFSTPQYSSSKALFGAKNNVRTPIGLTWTNISCTMESVSGPPWRRETTRKRVLSDVSGFAKPGTLTAIIGSSGAGKTTLLDILAGRKSIGILEGEVLANNIPPGRLFKRRSAYVTQEDMLMATLTVYETLMFNVRLKLQRDSDVSGDEREELRHSRVMEMVEELALEKCVATRIGNEMVRGVSGGEKKRTSIGCELVADPSLIFLDEPTTGLDAYNSEQVVLSLKKLAKSGRTIVCTLHQPRSSIFAMFDQLCCLSEGRVVYFGPANHAVKYFENEVGRVCDMYYNPADFIIDLALEDERRRHFHKQGLSPEGLEERGLRTMGEYPITTSLADVFEKSPEKENTISVIDSIHLNQDPSNSKAEEGRVERFAVAWPFQLFYLLQRSVKNITRNPATSVVSIFMAAFMSFFVGSIYHGTLGTSTQADVQNREGALFFCMTNMAFSQFQQLVLFTNERPLFLKEKASGMYRVSAYYMAKTFVDIPTLLIAPTVFCVISYFFVGFQLSFEKFLIFWLTIIVFVGTMTSLFTTISCAAPNIQVAQMVASLFTVVFFLFGGFYITAGSIPAYYVWIKYLSPFKYAFASLMKNEFDGLCFCGEDLDSTGDTGSVGEDDCGPGCESGLDVIASFGFEDAVIWRNLVILMGMSVLYRVLGYILLRFLYRQGR
mmetsp:Transcript_12942/g.36665  ORF Transcript_12942/g.36665 Transcript_12942/m.36665 type:complete len:696 (-) Transcript_12942:27-2114(-)